MTLNQKALAGSLVWLFGCVPYWLALFRWADLEVKVDSNLVLQLIILAVTIGAAWWGAMIGAQKAFQLQREKEIEAARLLAKEFVRQVNRRLSEWKIFDEGLNDGGWEFLDSFKNFDWLFLEVVINKIELFPGELLQQDIVSVFGFMKDLEYSGKKLFEARKEQIGDYYASPQSDRG